MGILYTHTHIQVFEDTAMIRSSIIILLILGIHSFAGRIIYPFNARTQAVAMGESLEIWYEGSASETVTSITLSSSLYTREITDLTVVKADVVYDEKLNKVYNIAIKTVIPHDILANLYDLTVTTSAGTAQSISSVKIVSEYKGKFTIAHLSDPHCGWSWEDNIPVSAKYFQEALKAISIISPEFVAVSGDIVHENTADIATQWQWYYEGNGDFWGIHDLNTITLSIPGNHDYSGNHGSAAEEWNGFSGQRYFGFSYGDTRLLTLDPYLGNFSGLGDYPGTQVSYLNDYLTEKGPGDLRIISTHDYGNTDVGFIDANQVQVGLHGHHHNNFDTDVGANTKSFTTGSTSHMWDGVGIGNLGWIRVLTIEDGAVVKNDAFQFGNTWNLTQDLQLHFEQLNDGSQSENRAVFTNNTSVEFFGAQARFVMAPGSYVPSAGEIEQAFHMDDKSIYDIRVTLPASQTTEVELVLEAPPEEPQINTAQRIPLFPEIDEPTIVSATVTDNVGISSVLLRWGTSEDNLENSVDMSSDGDIYSGEILGQLSGTTVYYIIEAIDGEGNSTPSETSYYAIEVSTLSSGSDMSSADATESSESQSSDSKGSAEGEGSRESSSSSQSTEALSSEAAETSLLLQNGHFTPSYFRAQWLHSMGTLNVQFTLPYSGKIILEIRNVLGTVVVSKNMNVLQSGYHENEFEFPHSYGLYIVSIVLESSIETVLFSQALSPTQVH